MRCLFFIFGALAVTFFAQANDRLPSSQRQELLLQQQNTRRVDPRRVFLTEDGRASAQLAALLELDGLYDKNDRLIDLIQKTQEKWIAVRQGQGNKERTDVRDTERHQQIRESVTNIAREMGLFDARPPVLQHYDHAVCLGAFLDGVRMRLAELVALWQQGVRFDSLVFLTEERYLRNQAGQEDDIQKLCNPAASPLPFKANWSLPTDYIYNTEYDLVRLVWDQVALPEDMARTLNGRVVFVNASRGKNARPSTRDTYSTWLTEYNPKPGAVLAPSHPLLWIYQHLVGINVLGKDFFLDTVAPALSNSELQLRQGAIVSLVHDTVAKSLYEEGFLEHQ